jgi:LysM repeat protein/predicted chitinase
MSEKESQITHTVGEWDTLFELAKKHKVTVSEIKAANNKTTDVIKKGDVLIIPKKTIIEAAHDAENKLRGEIKTHKVVSWDTLSTIADKYGTTVKILKKINGLKSDTIRPWQTLALGWSEGQKVDEKTKDITYAVKDGDTLYEIARKNDITVSMLKRLNWLLSDTIRPWQLLKLTGEAKEWEKTDYKKIAHERRQKRTAERLDEKMQKNITAILERKGTITTDEWDFDASIQFEPKNTTTNEWYIRTAFDDYIKQESLNLSENLKKQYLAYILATARHESDQFKVLEEYASGIWYEGRTDLWNKVAGDGVYYKWRGYVQLTGRINYESWSKRLFGENNSSLLGDYPEFLSHPKISALILVAGMIEWTFTKKELWRYVADGKLDFQKARGVINGSDEAKKIAGYADEYLKKI